MNGRVVVVCLFLFACSAGAAAQTVPQRDSQAVAALQAAINAMGGGAPSDATISGTVTAAGPDSQPEDGTIQILTRGTAESLETITFPNLSQTTIYAFGMAARTTGSQTQQRLTDQLSETIQTALYPLPLLVAAVNNSDTSLEYVGQETIGGVAAQHVRIWNTFASHPRPQLLAPFSTHDVWINAATGLPLKITFTQQAAEGEAFKTLVELDFLSYQRSSGFTFASLVKKSLNGTPWLTISIQSVAFNTGLQDSQLQITCTK
jgi:hypothetical protein